MENNNITKYAYIKPDGMRILFIYLMLENRQIVNYDRICKQFEISYKTFSRAIASIRDALNNYELDSPGVIIYNKRRNSYELIRI